MRERWWWEGERESESERERESEGYMESDIESDISRSRE
jgi:hypothetical protein